MYWEIPQTKYENVTSTFEGENTESTVFNMKTNQSRESRNVSSKHYPALAPRNPRTELATITSFNAIGERNNEYVHVQDGTTWKYWNGSAWVNVQTGLTSSTGSFRDFATGTTRYTILMNGTDKYAWDGSTVTDLTDAPASKIFTTHDGKIYIARDNDIVYSATNLINDYSTADDAGTIDVTDAIGVITGMTSFDGYVTAFTEYSMHKLYGTSSADFNLKDVEGGIGCISNNSIIASNGVLYWAWFDGIYATQGGEIYKVSRAVDGYFSTINFDYKSLIYAGHTNEYVYWAIPTGTSTSNNLILVYDTSKQKWYVESGNFDGFTAIGNVMYAVDSTGSIKNMNDEDGSETVSWYWISALRYMQPSKKKSLTEMWVTIYLPTGSTLSISTSPTIDGDDFTVQKTFSTDSDIQEERVQISVGDIQDQEWYRIKFIGTGECKVHFLEERFRVR